MREVNPASGAAQAPEPSWRSSTDLAPYALRYCWAPPAEPKAGAAFHRLQQTMVWLVACEASRPERARAEWRSGVHDSAIVRTEVGFTAELVDHHSLDRAYLVRHSSGRPAYSLLCRW